MAQLDLPCERARLEGMTVGQLARVYEEIVGEPTRSRHKQYLVRRILWRVQARAEGDLSERAKKRAAELADVADIRVSVLFMYSAADGLLELVANGGESVHFPLQQAFCKSLLGIDLEPAKRHRPVYKLQQLLDPAFTYPTASEDRINRVQLKSIRWKPLGEIRKLRATVQEFEFPICRSEWLELIQRGLSGYGVSPTQAVVEGATFRITLLRDGRPRTLEFTIVLPSRCTVRTKSDELMAIGKRCLKQWGIVHV